MFLLDLKDYMQLPNMNLKCKSSTCMYNTVNIYSHSNEDIPMQVCELYKLSCRSDTIDVVYDNAECQQPNVVYETIRSTKLEH